MNTTTHRELRCRGCRRRLGITTRPQPVPVQCTDPFCQLELPTSRNEERDSMMAHLHVVEGKSQREIASLVGLNQATVDYALAGR